jgi:hypothetical protein
MDSPGWTVMVLAAAGGDTRTMHGSMTETIERSSRSIMAFPLAMRVGT